MDTVEKLLAIEEIKQLKARYFRFVDTKDWKGFEGLFAPDAVMDISEDVPNGIFRGAAAIVAFVAPSLQTCVSTHHGHSPEIDITSATTATGIWAMEDMLYWPDGVENPNKLPDGKTFHKLHGYGHYFETYERIDGRWYIKTEREKRLRVDID